MPDRTRSGGWSIMKWRTAMITQSVGVPRNDERALVRLPHAQRLVQRHRVRGARLVLLRRHDPHVGGNLLGDAAQDVHALGADAVIVGDENAHQAAFSILARPPM